MGLMDLISSLAETTLSKWCKNRSVVLDAILVKADRETEFFSGCIAASMSGMESATGDAISDTAT